MKIKLRNRLEVLMKDSGVNSFEEMAQRLTDADHARILPLKKMISAAAQTIDSRDYEAAA